MNKLILNPHNLSEEEYKNFRVRNATRGIAINEQHEYGVIYVSKFDYYKLPGGGMKDNETSSETMARECVEELGCTIKNCKELPLFIFEVRPEFEMVQRNHIVLCEVDKLLESNALESQEAELGFEVQWLSFEKALSAFANKHPTGGNDSHYITQRDTTIVALSKKFNF